MRVFELEIGSTHFEMVADRIWQAFWRPSGLTHQAVVEALRGTCGDAAFPFTLVAENDGCFAGTVTAIEHDVAGRPEFAPCIAALWVEPGARRGGLGAKLQREALQRLADQGHDVAYLPARPVLRSYYSALGWVLVESAVGPDALDVYSRPTRAPA